MDKHVSQLKREHRRRKWWQNLVGSLAILVVFCTTYSLILNAITLEASEDPDLSLFTVNAVEYPGEYTWEDEAMGLSVTAALHGNASYVGTLSEGVMPELTVELDEAEVDDWLERYSEDEDMPGIPLMSLRIRLHVGDTELLLDKCQADVTLRMKRELFAGDIMATGLNLHSSELDEDLPEEPEPADPMEVVIDLDCDLGAEPPVQEPIVAWTAADEQAEQDAVELSRWEDESPDPEEPTDDPAIQDGEAPAEEPADPVSAEPPEQEPVEPSAPEQTEPAQPEETEPAQPEQTEPAQPEETEPAQPEETEPAQPEETEPAEDGSLLDEEEPVEVDQSIALVATDGENELGYADMPQEGDLILTFSIHADDPATIEMKYNPSFTIQHYLYFNQITPVVGAEAIKSFNENNKSIKDVIIKEHKLPILNASLGTPFADVNELRTEKLDFKTKGRIDNDESGLVGDGKLFFVQVGEDGTLACTEKLVRIFDDEENTNYRLKPQIGYMSRLYRGTEDNGEDTADFNTNYTMVELWVYTPTVDNPSEEATNQALNSTEEGDVLGYEFKSYPVPKSEDGKRHDPSRIRFTNNPSNRHLPYENEEGKVVYPGATEDYPYDYTVLIKHNSIIRLVFRTTSSNDNNEEIVEHPVNFFDYDITDGKIYNENGTVKTNASGDTYIRTVSGGTAQGINSSSNYQNSGAKFAFGGANTGIEDASGNLPEQQFGGDFINKGNAGVFRGCSFGLVSGMKYDDKYPNVYPNVIWPEGVAGPDLFSSNAVTGKKVRNDYKLGFSRTGGTYTLQYVKKDGIDEPVLKDLSRLEQIKLNEDIKYPHIFTNQFWPMDNETDEVKFGKAKDPTVPWPQAEGGRVNTDSEGNLKSGSIPASDDLVNDHNSYFGMSFEVDFTVHPGYCAPLAYWFFGDDDLWVFLTKLDDDGNPTYKTDENGKKVLDTVQIADIGGVHSSVGEYVNLWEYVEHIPLPENQANTRAGDASIEEPESQSYRMTVFYTERGASGSTCYMRFALPLDTFVSRSPKRDEDLVIEKVVLDKDGNPVPYKGSDENSEGSEDDEDDEDDMEFTFLLTLRNEAGANFEDVYHYQVFVREDTPNHTASDAVPIVDTIMGDMIPESGKYTFKLRNGEYAVISGLPDDTYYTIEELRPGQIIDEDGGIVQDESVAEKWITQYELGRHNHVEVVDENGNKTGESKEVNTILRSVRYNYRVGNSGAPGNEQRYLSHSENGYNYVRFINSKVGKSEVLPGDGQGVNVEDDITYDIQWVLRDNTTTVQVVDPLDEGVDFVNAKFVTKDEDKADANKGERQFDPNLKWDLSASGTIQIKEDVDTVYLVKVDATEDTTVIAEYKKTGEETEEDTVTTTYSSDDVDWKLEKKEVKVTTDGGTTTTFSLLQECEATEGRIAYVQNYSEGNQNGDGTTPYEWSSHEVRWDLRTELTSTVNCVSLKVKTNEKGIEPEDEAGKFGTDTSRVENTATVIINNDAFLTRKVENPLPDIRKEEITPGNKAPVDNGDEITYVIYWENHLNIDAQILIEDPLDTHKDRDPVVSSVTYDGEDGSAKAYYGEEYQPNNTKEVPDYTVEYDESTHTLRWDLGKQKAGAKGYVIFKVQVKDDAKNDVIWNQGRVKVGDWDWVYTNEVYNPIYSYELPTTGGSGVTATLTVGLLLMSGSVLTLRGRKRRRKNR